MRAVWHVRSKAIDWTAPARWEDKQLTLAAHQRLNPAWEEEGTCPLWATFDPGGVQVYFRLTRRKLPTRIVVTNARVPGSGMTVRPIADESFIR